MEAVLKAIFLLSVPISAAQGTSSPASPLRVALNTSAVSLDPASVQDDSSLLVSRHVNCQLVRLQGGTVILEAAKQMRFRSPVILEIVIRDDAKFHDGTPVTASDVVASLEYLRDSRGVFRNVFHWIRRIERLDEKRLQLILKKPIPQFLKVLAAPNYSIFKRDFLSRAKSEPGLWKTPLGCGKYRIGSSNRDRNTLTLTPADTGRPIEFHMRASAQLPREEVERYDIFSMPLVDDAAPPTTFRTEKYLDPGQYLLGLNTELPRWRNRANRCRFFSQLDVTPILKVYGEDAEAGKDIFPRGVLGYSPGANYQVELRAKHDAGQKGQGRDFCLKLHAPSVPEKYRNTYVDVVRSIFPEAKLALLETSDHFATSFLESHCDGLLIGFKSNYLDGYEYLLLFSEKEANFTGFWDRKLVSAIKESQNLEDPKAKYDSYQKIASRLREECVVYPMLTIPMRKIYVRKALKTPGLGTVPWNEYFLGQVE